MSIKRIHQLLFIQILSSLLFVFNHCAIVKNENKTIKSKNLIGTYVGLSNSNTTIIDSMKVQLPKSIISIILAKRRIAYAQIPYRGDNGLAKNKDGSYPRFLRKGKWKSNSDTLYLKFSGYSDFNLTYTIIGDTLKPINAPEKTIWIKKVAN